MKTQSQGKYPDGDDRVSSILTNHAPSVVRFFDDRIAVARPDVYPSRTVGQILLKPRNSNYLIQGSGSLISDYTVLTAGHVVKSADNEYYDIEWMRFIPAKNHGSEPYGRFDWEYIRAVRSGSRDWALISLAQGAGFSTGYLGTTVKLPISRWTNEGDRFSHIGFPGDHADEMWIDEDGRATGIYDDHQLITDIDAAHGQSGGPLALDWGGWNPRVVGSLVWGPNPVEDPNYFMPGWENTKEDTWFEWLCNEFGKRHPDDRFGGPSTLRLAQDLEYHSTDGQLPDYTQNHVLVEDTGPRIRHFGPRSLEHTLSARWMVQERIRAGDH